MKMLKEIYLIAPTAKSAVWQVTELLALHTALFPNRTAALIYARDAAKRRPPSEILIADLAGNIIEREVMPEATGSRFAGWLRLCRSRLRG